MKLKLTRKQIGSIALVLGIGRALIATLGEYTPEQKKREYIFDSILITFGMWPFIFQK